MDPQCLSWYALHVRVNHERRVNVFLNQLQILCFLPTAKISSYYALNLKRLEKPLFPGYLFCYMDLNHGPKLYNIPGLIKIVGQGGAPSPIPDEEMKCIQLIASSDIPVAPFPFLNRGDEVMIVRGPLRGIKGVYIETRGAGETLVVSFALLKRSLKIQLESDWIQPIRSTSHKEFLLAG